MRIGVWSSDVCSSDLFSTRTGGRQRSAAVAPDRPFQGTSCFPAQSFVCRVAIGRAWPESTRPPASSRQASQCTPRSEERRVGKECVSRGRSRRSPAQSKKKQNKCNKSNIYIQN